MATPLALPAGPTDEVERDRNSLPLAALLGGAGAVLLVFGLIAAYLAMRSTVAVWPPKNVKLDRYLGTTLAITMLMASVMVEWAAYGIRKGFRGQSLFGFGLTMLLGVAYLVGLAYLITAKLGYEAAATPYATVVYAMLGVAFAIGFVCLVAVLFAAIRTMGAQIDAWNYDVMRATAYVWHAATVAWIAVYYTIYITK